MQKLVYPSKVSGRIDIPASKSQLIRLIAGAMLANGETIIKNVDLCEDVQITLNIAELFACRYEFKNNILKINSDYNPSNKLNSALIDCGESALNCRLFAFISSLFCKSFTLTGKSSLLNRDMSELINTFKQLGFTVTANNNSLPINIEGEIREKIILLNNLDTSQIVSGLLFTLPLLDFDTEIIIANPVSKPYIDMTLEVLQNYGINIINNNNSYIIKGNQEYVNTINTAEGDWSNSAFFAVAGAICGNIEIHNLSLSSKQADKEILNIFKQAGINYEFDANILKIKSSEYEGFIFDAMHAPDLVPPIAILANYAHSPSKIINIYRLKNKESDRVKSIVELFKSLGGNIELRDNEMIIYPQNFHRSVVNSYNDHRIAMAGAIAGICSAGEVQINNAECVNKSFPEFWHKLNNIGAKIE